MSGLMEKSIASIGMAMEQGEISSVELVRFYLERIERYDKQGPCLNSIICINQQALADAEMLDDERKKGNIRSKLHGIPIVIKDNFNTSDLPTTAASLTLKNSRPAKDAFVVGLLKRAGAVIIAKTNLSEFAKHGCTTGSLIGQTLNPYDLSRTPGGSSGGTGTAVAANMAAAGMGSDTINSIRSPASATSLVGFRPTTGLISRSGLIPCSSLQDTAGPITRTVEDSAILLEICAEYDPDDAKTAQQIGRVPDSYTAHLKKDGLSGKRIGLLSNNFGNNSDVLAAMERAVAVLTQQGAQIVRLDVPELESKRLFDECDVQLYETKPLLNDYLKNIPDCPVTDINDLVASGKLHECIYSDMKKCAEIADPLIHPDYFKKLRTISQKQELVFNLMAQNQLDALCYPHQQILVELVANLSQNGRNGILASVLGFPAVTVPAGFSLPNQDAPIGVPIGIEFMARPFEESALIQIAYGYEQNSGLRKPPVCAPDLRANTNSR